MAELHPALQTLVDQLRNLDMDCGCASCEAGVPCSEADPLAIALSDWRAEGCPVVASAPLEVRDGSHVRVGPVRMVRPDFRPTGR